MVLLRVGSAEVGGYIAVIGGLRLRAGRQCRCCGRLPSALGHPVGELGRLAQIRGNAASVFASQFSPGLPERGCRVRSGAARASCGWRSRGALEADVQGAPSEGLGGFRCVWSVPHAGGFRSRWLRSLGSVLCRRRMAALYGLGGRSVDSVSLSILSYRMRAPFSRSRREGAVPRSTGCHVRVSGLRSWVRSHGAWWTTPVASGRPSFVPPALAHPSG